MEIPDDRYYGIQTSRMVKVSGCAHLPVIFYPGMHRALFRIKKACALANAEIGALKPEISRAVVEACDRALAGEFDKEFQLDMWPVSYTHLTLPTKRLVYISVDAASSKKKKKEIDEGRFAFSVELEDVHMNVEKRLTDDIGDAGARLHTARSRNDQCAADLHMYMRRHIAKLAEKLIAVEEALIGVSEKYKDVILPGYTHMQRAQPVLFAHHMMAYCAMLQRDFERLVGCYEMADASPLGACALAGTTYPTMPKETAEKLHFSKCYGNSLDAVSDRDYLLQFLSFASICMMHLSRLSEELILWSTGEFGFIELDDGYSTGSSIMPQKKNPDICELVRGKTGRVYGHLVALLTVMKGLPLAYDKDMQEDKEGVFDTIDTLRFALDIYAGILSTMTVNGARTRAVLENDFSNATDMADYLAKKGLPFRRAHAAVSYTHLTLPTKRIV